MEFDGGKSGKVIFLGKWAHFRTAIGKMVLRPGLGVVVAHLRGLFVLVWKIEQFE